MNALLGPDTGFDMINTATCGGEIAALLSALNDTDECPKTIIYSLNPGDDAQIGTILGCFQNSEVPGKIQHGSAWWFNDHKIGMEEQMSFRKKQTPRPGVSPPRALAAFSIEEIKNCSVVPKAYLFSTALQVTTAMM